MECAGVMLKRVLLDESGVSLTEVLVAGAMAAVLATAFLVMFSAFSRNVSLEESRARALTEAQTMAADLTSELRQATAVAVDGASIEKLVSTWPNAELVFYSDRADDAPGPERYRYYLDACSATHCDLMREVTVADNPTQPWLYTGTPGVGRVVADVLIGGADPLFQGADWTTGAEVITTACDPATPCDFAIVQIVMRVDPDTNTPAEEPLQVRHEVRLRNG